MSLMDRKKILVFVLSILLVLSTVVFSMELSDSKIPSRMTILTPTVFSQSSQFGIQIEMIGSDALWEKNVHAALISTVVHQSEEWQPILAEALPVAIEQDDGTYIASITLKPDLKFASGNDLTVEDVLFSYKIDMTKSIREGFIYTYLTNYLESNDSITYEGNTLYFHLKQYDLGVSYVFNMFIYEKAVFQPIYESCEQGDEEECVWQSMDGFYKQGAGPYKFKSWENMTVGNEIKESLLLEKNPYYWDSENVFIDEILYLYIKDASIAFSQMENHTIDLFDSFYSSNSTTYDPYPEIFSFKDPSNYGVQIYQMNHYHPIFGTGMDTPIGEDDPSQAYKGAKNVRKALVHIIDRDWVIDIAYDGLAEPAVTIVPSNSYGFDETLSPYPYDIDKAKSFMEEAGYDYSTLVDTDNDGLYDNYFFNFTLLTPDWVVARTIWSPHIVTEAAKIGINITNVPLTLPSLWELFGDWNSPLLPADQGGYDLMAIGHLFTKDWFYDHDFSNDSLIPGGNWSNYVNDSLAELFQDYNAKTDRAARSAILYEIQNVLHEEVVHLPVAYPYSIYGIHCRMDGMENVLNDYQMPWTNLKIDYSACPEEIQPNFLRDLVRSPQFFLVLPGAISGLVLIGLLVNQIFYARVKKEVKAHPEKEKARVKEYVKKAKKYVDKLEE